MAIHQQRQTMANPNSVNSLVPFGFKFPGSSSVAAAPAGAFSPFPVISQAAFDYHRAQMYEYTARLAAYGLRPGYPGVPGIYPQDAMTSSLAFRGFPPGARFVHEEPKPTQSYIGLIAMAILSSKDKKLVLSDIYQYILDNYSYFRNRGPGWRNSIRHNLSLNDCFVKSGRSANGKGHYWAIHPANVDDFSKGDFRRRRAQRKVRKHMGLPVPDEDDSPPPSPSHTSAPSAWLQPGPSPTGNSPLAMLHRAANFTPHQSLPAKKRLFDMDSLLAPDDEPQTKRHHPDSPHTSPRPALTSQSLMTSPGSQSMTSPRRSPPLVMQDNAAHLEIDVRSRDNSFNTSSDSPIDMSKRSPTKSDSSNPNSPQNDHSWTESPPTQVRNLYPSLQYPTLINSQTAAMAAHQWQETFSKILAKSYENELKVEIQ